MLPARAAFRTSFLRDTTMRRLLVALVLLVMWSFAIAAVNINTATKEDLDALPGIGPVKAQAIIDYRNANGPFKTPADIMKVKGIKEGEFGKIKDQIAVSGATTPMAAPAKATEAKKAAAAPPSPSPAPAKATEAAKAAPPAPASAPAAAQVPAAKDESKAKMTKADEDKAAKAKAKEDKAKKTADDKAAKEKAKEEKAEKAKAAKEEKAKKAEEKASTDKSKADKDTKATKDKATKDKAAAEPAKDKATK
jgi:competence protein ComEA